MINQLKPKVFSNIVMKEERKNNFAISKTRGIILKLIYNTIPIIIKDKIIKVKLNSTQKSFQDDDVIFNSRIIYETKSKKLLGFKSIEEYTRSYQAIFD